MFASLRESRWRIPVLLLLFTVFFYWKILFTNRYMFPWDAGDFFYPFFGFVHEELRHFRFPLWNPFSLAGSPIIGDPEAQIFYPLNWLYLVLHPFSPLTFKWVEAMEIAHFFMAGLFMYWLARDFTKDTLAALLGAVLFMSSGAMVAHTEHVATIHAMAWYPLIFLFARRGLLWKDWFWTISAGFFFGIENLVGHWQHSVYLGVLLFLYFAYEACAGPLRRQLWPHWMTHLLVIAAIGAGLAMIQIVPTAELGNLSIRKEITYWDITQGVPARYFWTLFLPNFFGGLNGVPWLEGVEPSQSYLFLTVPGLLLAVVGMIEMARRRNFFWPALILLAAEFSLGRGGHLGELIYRTPILNLFRQTSVFFDLGNFGLCLMAAFGMKALIDRDTRTFYHRWLPHALMALLLLAAVWGLSHQLAWKIPGWYHMLAVLALFTLLIALWQRGQIAPRAAQWAILLLMAFELCQYSMNQAFNWSINNPRTETAYDYAAHRKETLEFFRAAGNDFRVAAIDGSPWGSNGSNVWRIPAIFGWNPVMLRDYDRYIREFIHSGTYAQPFGGPDHDLESPLLDLLGVKYLLIIRPDDELLRPGNLPKFEKAFAEPDWRTVYRNKNYLSRTWFYPRAHSLPAPNSVLALMSSSWFDPRRTLLVSQPDSSAAPLPNSELLDTVPLYPRDVAAASGAAVIADNNCYEARQIIGSWKDKGSWVRFDTSVAAQPGRYILLIEYADPWDLGPIFESEITQGDRKSSALTGVLPRTSGWNCSQTRSAELGQFELVPGAAQITLTLRQDTPLNVHALWLVRLPADSAATATPLPAANPPNNAASQSNNLSRTSSDVIPSASEESALASPTPDFSFHDFDVSPNRYTLRAELPQDGFVLVNEIYYPGWEATVDGEPAEILKADYIFRALAVPAGSHHIEMRFRPRHFWLGASVSLLTLAGLLCYFALHRRRKPGRVG